MSERAGQKPTVAHDRKERFNGKIIPENEPFYAWLRTEAPEEVIEPELPIVDTHHHLWDHRGGKVGREQVVYKLPELLEDCYDGHNVVKTVFVQAGAFTHGKGVTGMPEVMRALGEVEYVQGVAALSDSGVYGQCRAAAGIIGTADFKDPDVLKVLGAQSRVRNFRGIRPQANGRLTDAGFVRLMDFLEKHDLVYEWNQFNLQNYAEKQLPLLKEIALKYPKVKIVMNHCGAGTGPKCMNKDQEALWKTHIAEIAKECPNVICKVGGIGMVTNGWTWEKRDKPIGSKELCDLSLPFYGYCIDQFGPQRCMVETNFPVDKASYSARVCWNALKRVANAKNLSAADKKAMFHDVAVKTYRLDDHFGVANL